MLNIKLVIFIIIIKILFILSNVYFKFKVNIIIINNS